MQQIKAIETEYAGHLFRSRLEARWAVFFDALSINWLYEPQGYLVHGQPYLPDFWISGAGLGLWVEVKGELDRAGLAKLAAAAGPEGLPFGPGEDRRPCDLDFGDGRDWIDLAGPGLDRILLLGDIPSPATEWVHPLLTLVNGRHVVAKHCGWWGMRHGYEPLAVGNWIPVGSDPLPFMPHGCQYPPLRSHSKISDAYRAARSARFEHGQSGAML